MKGNKAAKKILGVLFFKSAFTQRNVTSIGLVIIFFVIYVLAGGKIDAIPKIQTDSGAFGGISDGNKSEVRTSVNPQALSANKKVAKTKSGVGDQPIGDSNKPDLNSTHSEGDPFQNIEKRLYDRKKGKSQ